MDYQALTQAAGMFRGLAETMAPPEATAERPDPVETLKEEAEVNIPSAPVDAPPPEPEAAEVFAQKEPTSEPKEPEAAPVVTGAELDVNGLPWDGRIHASTKTKTVNGAWKNKRGVDKEILSKVEWELKNAMAAPETVLQEPTPAPVADIIPAATPEAAPAPSAAPGGITTFPALISAITAKSLDPVIVQGAITAVGLQSLPLLAARTDLIPQVAERLGL